MNKANKKILKWEIVSTIILNILIMLLCILDVLSWSFFVGSLIFTILITIIIFSVFIFIQKKGDVSIASESSKTSINEIEALTLAKRQLYDLKILEKVGEEKRKGIRYEGEGKDNIYEYLIRGRFSGKLISILVNMRTREYNVEVYDDSITNMDNIDFSIDRRANKLSHKPKDFISRTTVTESPFSNVKQTVREELIKEQKEKEESEGGLT